MINGVANEGGARVHVLPYLEISICLRLLWGPPPGLCQWTRWGTCPHAPLLSPRSKFLATPLMMMMMTTRLWLSIGPIFTKFG